MIRNMRPIRHCDFRDDSHVRHPKTIRFHKDALNSAIYASLFSHINYCWPAVREHLNMTIHVHLSPTEAGPSSAGVSSFATPAIDAEDTLRQVVTRLRTAKRIVVVSGGSHPF